MTSASRILGIGLWLGVFGLLGWQAHASFPLSIWQERLFLPLGLAAAGVIIGIPVLMPGAFVRLVKHARLLLPLLLVTLLEFAIDRFARDHAGAMYMQPVPIFTFGLLRFTVTAAEVAIVLIRVGYAACVTTIVLRVVRERAVGTISTLPGVRSFYVRVGVLGLIGWSVPFVAAIVAMAGAALSPDHATVILALFGCLILTWNLLTAALLPAALDERLGFFEALATGFRVSRIGLGRWWLPVVFQVLLLGLWTYPAWAVGIAHMEDRLDWQVHALWIGGFENHCHWYSDLIVALRIRPLGFAHTLLGLLCGIYAVALKLHIAGRLPPCVYFRKSVAPEILSESAERRRHELPAPGQIR